MKKRLLCLLLMVTLLVGLMPAAFAEGNIVSYTVKSGDTMLTICEDAGLDYYSCRWCIMKINGFYSESQLGMIYPGQTIKLPASVEVSAKIMSGELNLDGTVPEAKPAETPAPAEDKPADSGSGEANIIKHTVGEWDTLVKVCGSYGMNFYTVKYAIMKLNGFTSERQLDILRTGQVIKLPASENDAKLVMSSSTTTTKPSDSGTGTTGGTSTGSSSEAGESVAYYIIPYTFQSGDTVYNVCLGMGVDFEKNSDLIMKLNSIKDYRSIGNGKVLLIPSPKAPESGSYYKVVAHKLVYGETAQSVTESYGLEYSKVLNMMKLVNGKDSFDMIYAGTVLYVPVSCKA